MDRSPCLSNARNATHLAAVALVSVLLAGPIRAQNFAITIAAPSAAIQDEPVDSKIIASGKRTATIDCITPDGRISTVASVTDKNRAAIALLKDDDTLSCALPEGETTFIIALPSAAMLDRFTFVNENAGAQGELKIAVSNDQLPATSCHWVDVNGSVAFAQKRLFNLSMIGVDARYVKLSFNVARTAPITGIAVHRNGGSDLGNEKSADLKIAAGELLADH
ncbi:MAG: hypothetical protein ABI871_07490 [Chthoniobacterales bacterium]